MVRVKVQYLPRYEAQSGAGVKVSVCQGHGLVSGGSMDQGSQLQQKCKYTDTFSQIASNSKAEPLLFLLWGGLSS